MDTDERAILRARFYYAQGVHKLATKWLVVVGLASLFKEGCIYIERISIHLAGYPSSTVLIAAVIKENSLISCHFL
jgi:hypothetical protein